MASFTETATLRVDDQASGPINKINAQLKKLFRTANSMQGSKQLGLNVNVSKLAAAEASLKRITGELRSLKSAGNINIRVSATGLQQATRQAAQLRAQTAKPFTFRTLAAGLAGYGAVTKLTQGAKEGIKGADMGETGLRQLQLGRQVGDKGFIYDRFAAANAEIAKTEEKLKKLPGSYQFNTGLVAQRFAENLRETREGEAAKALRIPLDPNRPQDVGDPTRSRAATAAEKEAESRRRMNVAAERTYQEIVTADQIAKETGASAKDSLDKIKGYYKALDMAGNLADESGQNTVDNIKSAGDFIRTMRASIGEEATGSFFANLIRREKAAKFALTKEGQLAVAFIAEDMGPATAGTAFSTWQNQVQGARITAAARQEQVKAGLATRGRWEGKGKSKRFVADTVNAAKAQTDPLAYAREMYIPALKKMGMTEAQIFSNVPEDIALMTANFRKLYSETNAANFAITMMTHLLELESKRRDAATRDYSPEAQATATENSVIAASNSMASSFQGMAGQFTLAFAPAISWFADSMSTAMNSVAGDFKTAGDRKKTPDERLFAAGSAATKIGLAMAPSMLALAGISKILEKTGAGEALGKGSAMMAMMSQNEGMRALGGAGLSLMEAAGALKGAASAIAGANGIDLGDIPGGGGGGAKKGGGLWTKMKELSKRYAKTIGTAGAAAYPWMKRIGMRGLGLAATGIGLGAEFLTVSPEEAKVARDMLENMEKLRQAKRDMKNLEIESSILSDQKKQSQATKQRLADLERLKKALQAEIDQREKRRQQDQEIIESKQPTAVDDATRKEAADAEQRAAQARKDAAKAEEAAKPGGAVGAEAASETATATAITTAATSLAGTSTLFAQAFSTGAAQLTAAGQTAADIIRGGAAAAGSAYGEAAAAQIRAATANVTINVNNSGGGSSGTDTGALNRPK